MPIAAYVGLLLRSGLYLDISECPASTCDRQGIDSHDVNRILESAHLPGGAMFVCTMFVYIIYMFVYLDLEQGSLPGYKP